MSGQKVRHVYMWVRIIEQLHPPAQNLADNWEFTELWVDPTASPPYVLILLGDNSGTSSVYDPSQSYQLVFKSDTYEEAKLWLLEDEYERVEGRLPASVTA